jgi:malonyl CoA-acyl carrier protein transacylase
MQRYTFSHPNGLLFATRFAQIALVVTETATFDDMRPKGLTQCDSAFAGHSLGEFSALAFIADVLPISSLVDVGPYRDITMQSAVKRDSQNRSNYAMCAVTSHISKTFNEAVLREVVEIVGRRTDTLPEIANYNVDVCVSLLVTLRQLTPAFFQGSQYVAVGDLLALQTLTTVLNYLKKESIDLQKVQ